MYLNNNWSSNYLYMEYVSHFWVSIVSSIGHMITSIKNRLVFDRTGPIQDVFVCFLFNWGCSLMSSRPALNEEALPIPKDHVIDLCDINASLYLSKIQLDIELSLNGNSESF